MRTVKELREILDGHLTVDAHVHTHLCDGAPDMTVKNIAERAGALNIGAVILTPHFHKQVSDATETLYTDSKEDMLLALREEIDDYGKKDGRVKILLSTEVDILSVSGELSLSPSPEAERALDLITPTMNYNPILPLRGVRVTYGKHIDYMHESGEYARMAEQAGGVAAVLETMYETEVNALIRSPYPSMLGHFFAAHSPYPRYNWFGAGPEHMKIMNAGADRVIAACRETGALMDITGIHPTPGETPDEKCKRDGFLFDFQRYVVMQCRKYDVPAYPGSDAHELRKIGEAAEYYKRLMDYREKC